MQEQTYTLSKLQMYDECPQKYKLCYIDKVHIVENISKGASQQGNNIHNLINFYLKGEDVTKLITALSPAEKLLWHNFKNSEIKHYNHISSEYTFNLKCDEYWLTGRIDALFAYDNSFIIVDWKTGSNFKSENVRFQTTFYLFCIYEILKAKNMIKSPNELSLHYFDLASDSTVKIPFDEDTYTIFKNKILNVIHKINTNNAYFCNKTDNCKFCKYYRACPFL